MFKTLIQMLTFKPGGNIEFLEAVTIGSLAWIMIIVIGFSIYSLF